MNHALNAGIRGCQNQLANDPSAPRDVPQVNAQLSRLDDLTMVLKDIIQQLEDNLGSVMRHHDLKEGNCTQSPSEAPIMAPLAESLSNKNDRLQASIFHLNSLICRLEI